MSTLRAKVSRASTILQAATLFLAGQWGCSCDSDLDDALDEMPKKHRRSNVVVLPEAREAAVYTSVTHHRREYTGRLGFGSYKYWSAYSVLEFAAAGSTRWQVGLELVAGAAAPGIVEQAQARYTLEAREDGRCVAYRKDGTESWRYVLVEQDAPHCQHYTRATADEVCDGAPDARSMALAILGAPSTSHSDDPGSVETALAMSYSAAHTDDAEVFDAAISGLIAVPPRHKLDPLYNLWLHELQTAVAAKPKLKSQLLELLEETPQGTYTSSNALILLELSADERVQIVLGLLADSIEKPAESQDTRPLVRTFAHVTELRGGAPAEPTKEIIALLERTKSERVKLHVVRGLASIESPEATEALEKLAGEQPDGELPEWPATFADFVTVEQQTHHTKSAALARGYARVALMRRQQRPAKPTRD